MAWIGSVFQGTIIDKQNYAMTLSFTSRYNWVVWNLITVYGPCTEPTRFEFLLWFRSLNIQDDDNWMILGVLISIVLWKIEIEQGGDIKDTFRFNEAIGHLGLTELPLKGRALTWSNMQHDLSWSSWTGSLLP